MNSKRERILQRLRSAAQPHAGEGMPAIRDTDLYANHPAQEDLVERFGAKLASLKGEFFRVREVRQAAECVKELLAPFAAASKKICLRQPHALIDEVIAQEAWIREHTTPLENELSNEAFAQFEAGITTADFLIARTGSLVLNAVTAGGRRLSVLPPLHIVIATARQAVASLEEALAQIGNIATASYTAIITGPSRTSDIEKILVLGVHGPKRLAVIVIENSDPNL